jgi:hypothetical protein
MRTQLTNLEVDELSADLKKIYLEVGLSDSLQEKLLTTDVEFINQWLVWITKIETSSSATIANHCYQWLLEKSQYEPMERKVLGFTEEQEKKYKLLQPQIQKIEIIKKITTNFNNSYTAATLNQLRSGFDAENLNEWEKTIEATEKYFENNEGDVNIDPNQVQQFREMNEFLHDKDTQEFLKKGTQKCEEEQLESVVNSINKLRSTIDSLRGSLAQHSLFRHKESKPSTLSFNENNNEETTVMKP